MFFWNSLAFAMIHRCWQLISGSSSFSKSSLNILKFSVHVLLTTSLENFEHYFASVWDEWWVQIVCWFEHSLALPFSWTGVKTDLFQSCGHCRVFQIGWHIECSTFSASSFRIWNSSTGVPSPPLALFVVMLPKAHLTLHSRMSGYRWVITPLWLCRCKKLYWLSTSLGLYKKGRDRNVNYHLYVSWSCYNKLPQTWWLKTHTPSLTLLEARSLKPISLGRSWGDSRVTLSWEAHEKNPSLAPSSFWLLAFWPSLLPHCLFFSYRQISLCKPPSYKDICDYI